MTDTKTVPCEPTEAVRYVLRYGGQCRDCADQDGVCPTTGLPCDADTARKAVAHVIGALNYGRNHGFLAAAPAHQPDRQGAGGPVAWEVWDHPIGPRYLTRMQSELSVWKHSRALYAAPPPPADTAMREAIKGLVEVVEGLKGAVEHGTWRDDRGLRLKDTDEWVALYLAHNATLSRRDAAEGRG